MPGVRYRRLLAWLGLLALGLSASTGALAKCLPMAGLQPGIIRAALPAEGSIRLTYLGHSSFLIETPGGVTAVTDYNGINRPPSPPNIVTMNNAHSTHFTDFVRPEIDEVLRGWDPAGGMAAHDLIFDDLRVWNVPTNVRQGSGTRYNGNSIFVFEAGGLCVAHLGHLHHVLTETHLAELGEIDVLLVPVDGGLTMAQEYMLQVIEQIDPTVVVPMHYFTLGSLDRFLILIRDRYDPVLLDEPSVVLSRLNLPYRKVLVLPGR